MPGQVDDPVDAAVPLGTPVVVVDGEALEVLVAVLVGVAPRLVLPASWVLRREEDAAPLAVPGAVRDRLSG